MEKRIGQLVLGFSDTTLFSEVQHSTGFSLPSPGWLHGPYLLPHTAIFVYTGPGMKRLDFM